MPNMTDDFDDDRTNLNDVDMDALFDEDAHVNDATDFRIESARAAAMRDADY